MLQVSGDYEAGYVPLLFTPLADLPSNKLYPIPESYVYTQQMPPPVSYDHIIHYCTDRTSVLYKGVVFVFHTQPSSSDTTGTSTDGKSQVTTKYVRLS